MVRFSKTVRQILSQMKVIKSDSSGNSAFKKLFNFVQANNCTIVVWQVSSAGTRSVADSRLDSFQLDSGRLQFLLSEEISINSQLPLYFYSESGQFIFKSAVLDVQSRLFVVNMPTEIRVLEEPEVTIVKGHASGNTSDVWRTKRLSSEREEINDYIKVKSMRDRSTRDQDFLNQEFDSVSLDEEDRMFADKRESPRARPKADKFVKLKGEATDEIHVLRLFDLSRGGLGFISMEPHLFPKGSQIRVMGFDSFQLDDPLLARVMSQRPIDETQIEFKIGCKFDEGQD